MSEPSREAPDFEASPRGTMIRLEARDGHVLDAYRAVPAGRPRGGLVVAQEMYGLTGYLMAVCDFFADQGYQSIAPALYDRRRRGLVFSYNPAERDLAHATFSSWPWEPALDDLDAAKAAVLSAGKVGIMGFCWGGSLSWLAACRRDYDAAVAYYGSAMPEFAHEQARCPVLANCGDRDTSMPIDAIRSFEAAQPEVTVIVYPGAQHAFDNPLRGGGRFDPDASAQARAATLAHLRRHIG